MRSVLSSCSVPPVLGLFVACILTLPGAGFAQPADDGQAAEASGDGQGAEASGDEPDAPRTRQEILRRQREAKQAELEPYTVSPPEQRVRSLERWRLPQRLFAKGLAGVPAGYRRHAVRVRTGRGRRLHRRGHERTGQGDGRRAVTPLKATRCTRPASSCSRNGAARCR